MELKEYEYNEDNAIETNFISSVFLEEETEVLEVAASFGTLSTLGTATGCASTLGTVSCIG